MPFFLYNHCMGYSYFSALPIPKPDPLFAIAAEAQAAGPTVINGTLGIYMDEDGKPLVLPSVKLAVADLQENLQTFSFSYPPLNGLPDFRETVTRLLIGERTIHVASIASTGGTGALAINLRLLKMMLGDRDVPMIVPTPAWANHLPVCKWAGLSIVEAPYLENGKASIAGIVDVAKKIGKPFGLLLQVGCHNPTGLDLDDEQTAMLIAELKKLSCIILLDFAYQGFKEEPEQDAVLIGKCIDAGLTTLVTWSASKNHSIYGLRTGLAAAIASSEEEKKTVDGNYSTITRGLHSAAPTFGQAIVATVQKKFSKQWRDDLRSARLLMKRKRELLIHNLPDSFHASLRGYGMFAILPLTEPQVTRLKVEEQVFLPLDGRINIAGIPEKRIRELCGKIARVM
ncbi:aminotransferase class I/II-fold pyridoxal phosphate-dependent enzyme [Candidatus Peribacteria bacterium]|nr:aminotransferase class I/II-fold pyridoxal phosphate-dependent enzyme [Candidatus Peribacteria bacterium]